MAASAYVTPEWKHPPVSRQSLVDLEEQAHLYCWLRRTWRYRLRCSWWETGFVRWLFFASIASWIDNPRWSYWLKQLHPHGWFLGLKQRQYSQTPVNIRPICSNLPLTARSALGVNPRLHLEAQVCFTSQTRWQSHWRVSYFQRISCSRTFSAGQKQTAGISRGISRPRLILNWWIGVCSHIHGKLVERFSDYPTVVERTVGAGLLLAAAAGNERTHRGW